MTQKELEALYNVEVEVEKAVCAALHSLRVPVIAARSVSERKTPRVEVGYSPGAALDHRITYSGGLYYTAWDGTLTFRVISSRRGAAAEHMVLVARIRLAMQQGRDDISIRLTKHAIVDLREADTRHTIIDDAGLDVTDIDYRCVVGIRSDAWT